MTRTSSVLFWFGLALVASVALYHTSDRVQQLNHQLAGINTAIEAEQQSIHVLKAEWVYLANPQRIETLTKKHLALRPTALPQMATLDTIAELLPTRHEAMATVAVTDTPMANVMAHMRTSMAAPSNQPVAMAHHKTPYVAVASLDTGHITERMLIQHSASIEPLPAASPDQIGMLISQLDTHP